MKLTHDNVVALLDDWLRAQDYTQVRVSNLHWIPDSAFLTPDKKLILVYEVKQPGVRYGALRHGLIQTLEGIIYGFKSYLVISRLQLSRIDKFLLFLPQLGIITYSDVGELSITKEAEIPLNAEKITYNLLNSESTRKIVLREKGKHTRRGTAVKVKNYSYTRAGKNVESPAYTRKKPNRTNNEHCRQRVLKIKV